MPERDPKGLIAALIDAPSGTTLRALFCAVMAKWPHPMRHEEGYTVGAFDDLEQQVGPAKAFALLPEAARLALEQTDSALKESAMSLLLGLVRSSNTTEISDEMRGLLVQLKQQSTGSSYLREIEKWYRLTS
jgi:hypothetical protein